MNIKSLLIGSAAAIVAVSGARAADAVVIAEPEPFEYVRVCDTYGVGFYYIPGTETCLRIGGLIRYNIDFSEDNEFELDRGNLDALVDFIDDEFEEDAFGAEAGALGDFLDTLRADIDGDGDLDRLSSVDLDVGDVNGDGAVNADDVLLANPGLDPDGDGEINVVQPGLDEGWAKQAYARVNIDARSETEWGTFRRYIRMEAGTSGSDAFDEGIFGLPDRAAVSVIHAYVELGGLLVGLYDTLYDGDFGAVDSDNWGGTRAHQIRYTFNGSNGWTFQMSLEEQDYNYDYTPNVVGRVALAQGWGSVAVFAAYDATFEEVGVKGLAAIEFGDVVTLELGAAYESGFGDFSVCSANGLCGYEFTLGAALNFKATDQLALGIFGQYYGDQHWISDDNYVVGAEANWTPVENLLLRGQVNYNGGDSQDFIDGRIRLEAAF